MDINRRLCSFGNLVGEAHMVGVGVGENDGGNVFHFATDGAESVFEHAKVARKAGVYDSQAAGLLDHVPVEGVCWKMMYALGEFHDCVVLPGLDSMGKGTGKLVRTF